MIVKNDRKKLAVELRSSERSLEEFDWCQWRPLTVASGGLQSFE